MKPSRPSSLGASGLRTRYSPKSRVGQGLAGLAPWLSLVLLIAMFTILQSKIILQPGIVMELPQAPFREGTEAGNGKIAVVLSVSGPAAGTREAVVFFDDERFLMSVPAQMDALRKSLGTLALQHPGDPLVLLADRRIPHGKILDLVNMAMGAGVRKINMATKASPN